MKLKQLLIDNGISQHEFSVGTEVNASAVNKILNEGWYVKSLDFDKTNQKISNFLISRGVSMQDIKLAIKELEDIRNQRCGH